MKGKSPRLSAAGLQGIMGRDRRAVKAAAVLALLWTLLAVFACEPGPLAGASVGTGNPTELSLAFVESDAPARIDGAAELFLSDHLPIPGFDSLPLHRVDLKGASRLQLDSAELRAALRARGRDSLLGPGTGSLFFNVVVRGQGRGTFIAGLEFDPTTGRFGAGASGLVILSGGEPGLVAKAPIVETVDYAGEIAFPDNISMDTGTYLKHLVFIRGTGFASEMEGKSFRFAGLPRGKYEMLLVSLLKEYERTGNPNVYDLHGLDRPLDTESTEVYTWTGTKGKVLLPQE